MAIPFDAGDPTPKDCLPSPEDPAIAPDVARSLIARAVPGKDGQKVFTLGTRQSKLAMVQTEIVKKAIEQRWPDLEVRIFGMTTAGDKNQSKPLYMLGGKGAPACVYRLSETWCADLTHAYKRYGQRS